MPTPFRFSQSVRCHFVAALLALAPAVLGATSYTIATFADDAVGNGNCTLREAIRRAVSVAMGGGWSVLVAGKGHENAQIVGNQRLPFSDRDEIERAVAEHRASEARG